VADILGRKRIYGYEMLILALAAIASSLAPNYAGTAGAWFLLDFCYYGNTISSPEILAVLNPHASLLHNTLVQLGIFAVFAVPGYVVAILLMDSTGRDLPSRGTDDGARPVGGGRQNRRVRRGLSVPGHAGVLVGRLSGEVVAMFCWQMPFFGVPGGFDHEEIEEDAKALLLQAVATAVPEPPVPLVTVVAHGDPTEALIEASKDADLLVLGTRAGRRSPG
jgi:nucleotide-binding universal stress UspA family protein